MRRNLRVDRGADAQQASGSDHRLLLNALYRRAELRAGDAAFAGVRHQAGLGPGLEHDRRPLYAPGHRACGLSDGLYHALSQDYIRTAKAKGVRRWKIIFKHALRNSLVPVITYAGPQIAYIITGSMVVETIFTVGGIGSKFVSAITNRDYTLIMGTTIFLATLMVMATLICDLLYKVVDPRIKYE